MYLCDSWTIKDAFELWHWRGYLKVPWAARRSNQSILKEINPEYSLEGLKLKLQSFGHMRRTALWPGNPTAGHTHQGNQNWDTCTPVFITALFIIARTWKQPRRPSADEWIRKLWSIYTMEYYSDIKKNTFESVLMRWMKLEPIKVLIL